MTASADLRAESQAEQAPPLLEVRNLAKHYHVGARLGQKASVVRAVDGIGFALEAGKTLAIVGESGCGKTTTAKMILLLEKPTEGSILLDGEDISRLRGRQLRPHHRLVQAVLQDPYSSLNPRMRVHDIVGEPLRIHDRLGGRQLTIRVEELLDQVGLSPSVADSYPHQFSGGQRQRIAIARALSVNPKLIVLDEPVSALDVSIRAQILNLLVDLQQTTNVGYLLISHDLAIVEHMSHDVLVMYAGRVAERSPSRQLYEQPRHPYTHALLAAVPRADPDLPFGEILAGEVANPADPPPGCRFHPRCRWADEVCKSGDIEFTTVGHRHEVACRKVEEIAGPALHESDQTTTLLGRSPA